MKVLLALCLLFGVMSMLVSSHSSKVASDELALLDALVTSPDDMRVNSANNGPITDSWIPLNDYYTDCGTNQTAALLGLWADVWPPVCGSPTTLLLSAQLDAEEQLLQWYIMLGTLPIGPKPIKHVGNYSYPLQPGTYNISKSFTLPFPVPSFNLTAYILDVNDGELLCANLETPVCTQTQLDWDDMENVETSNDQSLVHPTPDEDAIQISTI